MKGPEGTIGKTIIWIDPVGAGRGTVVQSRILTFTLGGARLLDWTLRYTEPRRRPAVCDGFFLRPRIETLPAPGPRGIATIVYYSGHFWGRSAVAVQAATVPSADSLRACLRPGDWGDLGSRVLGRTKTTEFAATANELAGPGFEHLWVDSAAFLPVKLLESDDAERITFGFKFLPPTPANKALLRLPIPTGFVKRQL